MNQLSEKELFNQFKNGDNNAFEQLFRYYYEPLCIYASRILQDNVTAEEVVQDFFVKFWERRNSLVVESSLKNYLFRSVKNRCLNRIEHEKIKMQHAKYVIAEAETHDYNDQFLEVDLKKDIEESIASLPEKRREIFRLSREEGLKYREIAEKLNLSIKTVEAQMGLAIKTLRDKLKKYNSFLFFLFCFRVKKH
ncbi:RNA polymerase sigma-70 factor [Maribellus mangrovi]|uniref:RNA polymerase sigma-70 factor n=1 Tax=Maribellus mangrovi TaxID=3133146 RepID=UPI0030EB61A2